MLFSLHFSGANILSNLFSLTFLVLSTLKIRGNVFILFLDVLNFEKIVTFLLQILVVHFFSTFKLSIIILIDGLDTDNFLSRCLNAIDRATVRWLAHFDT